MDTLNLSFTRLLEKDDSFRRLYEEHLKYERQLKTFEKAHYLTPEQEMQRKTVQKLKLSGKDQMLMMVQQSQSV